MRSEPCEKSVLDWKKGDFYDKRTGKTGAYRHGN
nr:MAG TPA: hypothetical protein [Caudoviricetes sp.]